jgi:hypothetical protein
MRLSCSERVVIIFHRGVAHPAVVPLGIPLSVGSRGHCLHYSEQLMPLARDVMGHGSCQVYACRGSMITSGSASVFSWVQRTSQSPEQIPFSVLTAFII